MSCNCGKTPCRCPKMDGAPKRAYIDKCTDCDPCKPCDSMVKICSFVVANIEEGQTYRNSFVYNQQDDAVYYISDDGTPTRFGASPMFINAFDPEERSIPRQTVYDFMNEKAYIYDPEGNYKTIPLGEETPAIEPQLEVTFSDFQIDSFLSPAFTVTMSNPENLDIFEIMDAIKNGRRVRFLNIPYIVSEATGLPLENGTFDAQATSVANLDLLLASFETPPHDATEMYSISYGPACSFIENGMGSWSLFVFVKDDTVTLVMKSDTYAVNDEESE